VEDRAGTDEETCADGSAEGEELDMSTLEPTLELGFAVKGDAAVTSLIPGARSLSGVPWP